ncbi:Dimeric alpha-beta barrel [Penicillium mononematosum]|uniref:Dimeric alpha-beta barrel n=1 Tax=Penicillium mononematosum TaxID=268346 RepID=UPI0025483261|nr:Dimeric alpha-beta barrel [Penicillium mononematosum]KAJ6188668.1 Dimeric alpha-beta barrel [Penicillium mononematosum]
MADPTADRLPVGNLNDRAILIWTEFKVPKDLELDTEWAGHFQPLISAPGHKGSGWTRLQGSPDTILLITEVLLAPSLARIIRSIVLDFPIPMTEAQKVQILKLKAIREPALGINGQHYRNKRRQLDPPLKIWATHTESVHGQEAQLMLSQHFWRNAESAEYRHLGKYSMDGRPIVGGRTLMERLSDSLENAGAIGWKVELVGFTPIGDRKFYGHMW